jgi:hypothetical protein
MSLDSPPPPLFGVFGVVGVVGVVFAAADRTTGAVADDPGRSLLDDGMRFLNLRRADLLPFRPLPLPPAPSLAERTWPPEPGGRGGVAADGDGDDGPPSVATVLALLSLRLWPEPRDSRFFHLPPPLPPPLVFALAGLVGLGGGVC